MKKRSLVLSLLLLLTFGSLAALAAASGEQLWVKRHTGTDHYSPESMAIDSLGNAYVLGDSYSDTKGSDFLLIKYNTSGAKLWTKTYNGPGNGSDNAKAIAIDTSNNIYVAGSIYNNSTHYDFALIKYDPNGNIVWQRTYSGPGSESDTVAGIAIDANGNVYLTGSSDIKDDSLWGYNSLFVTIKYNRTGTRKWIKKHDFQSGNHFSVPVAIAVDSKANVIVTGMHSTQNYNGNFVTIKYDTNGELKWLRSYDGVKGDRDMPSALVLDKDGNSYITGTSQTSSGDDIITIKYNRTGTRKWVRKFNKPESRPFDLAVDENGNCYVTGQSANNIATIKYDTNGNWQWNRYYNGPGNWQDAAESIKILDGNIYITGFSYSGNSDWDFITIKYSPTGTRRWLKTYNGPANDFDAGVTMATGADAIYVAGESARSRGSDWDIVTIKYQK